MPIVQILIVAAIFMFFYFGVKGLNGGPIKLSKEKDLVGGAARIVGFICLLLGLGSVGGIWYLFSVVLAEKVG